MVCTFSPPFFLPLLGLRPTPLKTKLENKLMVVESIIFNLLSQLGVLLLFRLSDERTPWYLSYRVAYIVPKTFSGLLILASESVLLLGILVNPRCDSFLDSAAIEVCISRNESNLIMMA